MTSTQDPIVALRSGHARLAAAAHAIAPDDIIYPQWRIKEVIAHLSGWDDAAIATLEAYRDGLPPPTPAAERGIDFYNGQAVEERESLTLEQVLAEWEQTRSHLYELIEALAVPLGEVKIITPWGTHSSMAEVLGVLIHHDAEHAEVLEQLHDGM